MKLLKIAGVDNEWNPVWRVYRVADNFNPAVNGAGECERLTKREKEKVAILDMVSPLTTVPGIGKRYSRTYTLMPRIAKRR